jgi:hypothetical protein
MDGAMGKVISMVRIEQTEWDRAQARIAQLERALSKIRMLRGTLFDAVMIAAEAMGSVAEQHCDQAKAVGE